MEEYRKEKLILILCLVIFVIGMWLVISGQKQIGFTGLGKMMAGLVLLLGLLGFYNYRQK